MPAINASRFYLSQKSNLENNLPITRVTNVRVHSIVLKISQEYKAHTFLVIPVGKDENIEKVMVDRAGLLKDS